jgi:hypothetical protein
MTGKWQLFEILFSGKKKEQAVEGVKDEFITFSKQ